MHGEARDITEGSTVGDTFFSFLSFFLLRAQCFLGLLRGDLAGFLYRGRVRFGGNVGVRIGGIVTEIAYSANLRWELQRLGVLAFALFCVGFASECVLPLLDVKAGLEAGCLHALRCILPHFEILVSRELMTCLGCVFPFGEDCACREGAGGCPCTGVSFVHGAVGSDVGVGISACVAHEQVSRGDVAGWDGRSGLGAPFEFSFAFESDGVFWRTPNVERGHSTTSRFGAPGELAVWSLVDFSGRPVGTISQDMAFLLAMMACS